MKLYIVIVSFNGGEILSKLINDLNEESEVEIVVVENGSEEAGIRNYGSRIKIIRNNKNLGFAKGANIGIRYALKNGADRILLLNQDVVIGKEFMRVLINNSADIISPVIKFKRNNQWIYDYGGRVNWWIGRTYHLESDNYPFDYVSGCAMLVKRRVFENIGFLDENFFLYFEDVDFCLRAKKTGFKIAIESKSRVTHELIEGKERSIFKKYHLLRSNFIFINKYLREKRFLGYLYLLALAVKMFI